MKLILREKTDIKRTLDGYEGT